jgi:hypothetical protein
VVGSRCHFSLDLEHSLPSPRGIRFSRGDFIVNASTKDVYLCFPDLQIKGNSSSDIITDHFADEVTKGKRG